jgi:hypothetical protein
VVVKPGKPRQSPDTRVSITVLLFSPLGANGIATTSDFSQVSCCYYSTIPQQSQAPKIAGHPGVGRGAEPAAARRRLASS